MNKQLKSKKSKYNAKKHVIDGITFASKLEAGRYQFLKAMEAQGVIRDLELQPKFLLQTSFRIDGHGLIREIGYKPDFRYTVVSTGQDTVEETKGMVTPDYTLRKKMFLKTYVLNANLKFWEVKTVGDVRQFE